MTIALYLTDTYLMKHDAIITHLDLDEKGAYIVLDQTIFYPQSGGQPADQGNIHIGEKEILVHFVRQIGNEIRHYVQAVDQGWLKLKAHLKIDHSRRILNARYHTAAHLLGNIVEDLDSNLKAVKGHSFPGEAYVEYRGSSNIELPRIQESIDQAILQDIPTLTFEITATEFEKKFYKLPYEIPSHKQFRAMQIGHFPPVPCGGTHVASTLSLKSVVLRKISNKGDSTKITYQLD